jgi:hypothetical protein
MIHRQRRPRKAKRPPPLPCDILTDPGGKAIVEPDRRRPEMDKFIPKEKLSPKAKRELARTRRQTWGGLNPVTRRPKNPKAYEREKPRIDDDGDTGVF